MNEPASKASYNTSCYFTRVVKQGAMFAGLHLSTVSANQPAASTHGGPELSTLNNKLSNRGGGLSVSPWHLYTGSAPRRRPTPLAFTEEKVNKMVEQIRVT